MSARPSGNPNSSSSFQAHPSLPQKPPATISGPSKASAFKPRSVTAQTPSGPHPLPSYPSPQSAYPAPYAAPAATYASQPSYYPTQPVYTFDAAYQPQISNPFVAPTESSLGADGSSGSALAGYTTEEQAALAQWQSAYAGSNEQLSSKPSNSNAGTGTIGPPKQDKTNATEEKKKKTVIRAGGGHSWEDDSLLDWDPAHPRFFVGNLAGEVSDDSLLKAFAKYPSVVKARVVRDKRTTKSKGFGFISFSNADDFARAGKEMNGKYIGSHPIILRRAKTDLKPVTAPEKYSNKRGKGNAPQSGGHAHTKAGIQKQKKTKGGLEVLG